MLGDVAGMGADLFESFVGSIIGSMVLGSSILVLGQFDIRIVIPAFIHCCIWNRCFYYWDIHGFS